MESREYDWEMVDVRKMRTRSGGGGLRGRGAVSRAGGVFCHTQTFIAKGRGALRGCLK